MAILEMKHISKAFSGVYANEDIDLSVEKGEIHALLGENGAGKTTLMNIYLVSIRQIPEKFTGKIKKLYLILQEKQSIRE